MSITIETKGQLGNQLFEYATCRSIAEKHGYNFHITFYPIYKQIQRFNISFGKQDGEIHHTLNSDYCINYLYNHKKLPTDFLNIKDNTRLIGYFQQSAFFDFNFKNIQKWFSTDNIIDLELFKQLYNKYQNYCFIHIRGGDFKDIVSYKLPVKYYKQAILEFKNLKFVIVTDDPCYSQTMFTEYDIISSDDYLIDFKLLQTAKYVISSNSTFSWWASYLNTSSDKIIYPYGGLTYGVDSPHFSKCNKFRYIGKL